MRVFTGNPSSNCTVAFAVAAAVFFSSKQAQRNRSFVGAMIKKRDGRIIGVSSVVAHSGNVGQANYCAAKAGMEGFIRAVACEIGGRGVTINAVAPGFIDTDMTKKIPADWRQKLLDAVPLKRAGQPSEVADAIAFLASKKASYITGHTLHINGGMFMG